MADTQSSVNKEDRKSFPKIKPPSEKLNGQPVGVNIVVCVGLMVALLATPLVVLWTLVQRYFAGEGKSLKGKVALVTGAGRGLGRALAVRLSHEGCKVVCVDIDETTVTDTADIICKKGLFAKPYVVNVAVPEEVQQLAENVGPVDVLVNNAALLCGGEFLKYPNEYVTGVVNVNFLSHFWMMRAFLPSMKERNSGHIVAISSVASMAGVALAAEYASCKWAVSGLMECVRAELRAVKGNNIQTTTVCPWFINTSETYTESWKIPIPELSIDDVVEKVITGIRHDYVEVLVPESMCLSILASKLLPWSIRDRLQDLFDIQFTIPDNTQWASLPTEKIIRDSLPANSTS